MRANEIRYVHVVRKDIEFHPRQDIRIYEINSALLQQLCVAADIYYSHGIHTRHDFALRSASSQKTCAQGSPGTMSHNSSQRHLANTCQDCKYQKPLQPNQGFEGRASLNAVRTIVS